MSALLRKLKRVASTTSAWLADESSDVESTYVAKPRYHHKRKSRKVVRWFTYITSDLQRLTAFTLIVVLVCGLATVALLSLLGSPADQRIIIKEAPAPEDPSLNTRNDLESSPQQEAVAPTDITSPKQESEVRARPDQNARPASVSGKSASSTNVVRAEDASRATKVVRAEKGDASRAKGVPSPLATKSPTNTQRPRRATGKNDRSVPVATSDKNNKPKVIQWP